MKRNYSGVGERGYYHPNDPLVVNRWSAKTRAGMRRYVPENPLGKSTSISIETMGQNAIRAYIDMRSAGMRPDAARSIIVEMCVCGGGANKLVSWDAKYETPLTTSHRLDLVS